MWKYATRRVLTMIPILIGVSMVVFLLVASLPGDAVDAHAGIRAIFTSRWVFSIILAASATLILGARCTPA